MEIAEIPLNQLPEGGIGGSGLKFSFMGEPENEYNYDYIRRLFQGDYWNFGKIDRMHNDATVRGTFNTIALPFMNTTLVVEPASNDAADQEVADFVHDALVEYQNINKRKWHDISCVRFGYLPSVYGYKPVAWRSEEINKTVITLNPRRPATNHNWEVDRITGEIFGFTQRIEGKDYTIPASQMHNVVFQEEFGNPEGNSLYRPMGQSFDNKQKVMIIGLMNLEKMGGILVNEGVENWKDINKLKQNLKELRVHERGYISLNSDQGTVKLLSAGGTAEDHIKWLMYFDNGIARVGMTEFKMLGSSTSSGSFALGEVLRDEFLNASQSLIGTIEDSYNTPNGNIPSYVKSLVDENFTGVKNYCKVTFKGLRNEDVEQLAKAYEVVEKSKGISLNDEKLVRERLKLMNDEIKDDLEKAAAGAEDRQKQAKQDKQAITVTTKEKKKEDDVKPVDGAKQTSGELPSDAAKLHKDHGEGCGCGGNHMHMFKNGMFPVPLKLNREMTKAEENVNFSAINDEFNSRGVKVQKIIEDTVMTIVEKKVDQAGKLLKKGDTRKLRKLEFTTKERESVAEAVADEVNISYEFGMNSVKEELKKQKDEGKFFQAAGVTDIGDTLEVLATNPTADMIGVSIDNIFNEAETILKRDGLTQISLGEIDTDTIEANINKALGKEFPSLAFYFINAAINQGREDQSVLSSEEIEFSEYSAIMDENTCADCKKKDGQRFQVGTAKAQRLRVPNPMCFSAQFSKNKLNRCRCIWVFVLKEEAELGS